MCSLFTLKDRIMIYKYLIIIVSFVSFCFNPALSQEKEEPSSFEKTLAEFGKAKPVVPNTPRINTKDRFVPVIGRNGMVSSREKIATRIGVDILEKVEMP